jgi:hypothetical protein
LVVASQLGRGKHPVVRGERDDAVVEAATERGRPRQDADSGKKQPGGEEPPGRAQFTERSGQWCWPRHIDQARIVTGPWSSQWVSCG